MSNSTVNKVEANWLYKIQLWRKENCPKNFGGGLAKRKETYFSFLFVKKHMYLRRFSYKVGDSFPLFRKLLSFMRLVSEGHPPLKNIVGPFCFQNSMYLIFAPRQMERQMERQKHQVGLFFVYFHNIFLCENALTFGETFLILSLLATYFSRAWDFHFIHINGIICPTSVSIKLDVSSHSLDLHLVIKERGKEWHYLFHCCH